MRFDVLQMISLAGDAASANDDRVGASDAIAWVIDGATDLGEPGLLGTRGGAAWIAMEANAAFAAAGDASIRSICNGAAARSRQNRDGDDRGVTWRRGAVDDRWICRAHRWL